MPICECGDIFCFSTTPNYCPNADGGVCEYGTCTNTQTDVNNCGTCGTACASGATCVRASVRLCHPAQLRPTPLELWEKAIYRSSRQGAHCHAYTCIGRRELVLRERARRWRVMAGRRRLIERLVRSFVVARPAKPIEDALLGREVGGCGSRRLGLECRCIRSCRPFCSGAVRGACARPAGGCAPSHVTVDGRPKFRACSAPRSWPVAWAIFPGGIFSDDGGGPTTTAGAKEWADT